LGPYPYWAKDPSIGYKLINARSETVGSKPAFREAFESRRCLIPADGFYEWKRTEKAKQPFHFGLQDDSLFAFAGLWDRWRDPGGQVVESCSILTTAPNSLLANVHNRMPVILSPEHYDLWLDPGFKRVEALKEMLNPFDAMLMKRYPVSTRVNFVKNDDPECATALQAVNAAGAT
jgi:putative SOS response-associated peptidase YedK